MSTKIYNGIQLPKHWQDRLPEAIELAHANMVQHWMNALLTATEDWMWSLWMNPDTPWVSTMPWFQSKGNDDEEEHLQKTSPLQWMLYKYFKEISQFKERLASRTQKEDKETLNLSIVENVPLFDWIGPMLSSLRVLEHQGKVYGLTQISSRPLSEQLQPVLGWKDFHYQNQSDRPEEVSARAWNQRAKIWDALFDPIDWNPEWFGVDVSLVSLSSAIALIEGSFFRQESLNKFKNGPHDLKNLSAVLVEKFRPAAEKAIKKWEQQAPKRYASRRRDLAFAAAEKSLASPPNKESSMSVYALVRQLEKELNNPQHPSWAIADEQLKQFPSIDETVSLLLRPLSETLVRREKVVLDALPAPNTPSGVSKKPRM